MQKPVRLTGRTRHAFLGEQLRLLPGPSTCAFWIAGAVQYSMRDGMQLVPGTFGRPPHLPVQYKFPDDDLALCGLM